jgi:LysR family glycine cleavage system transcriptional activator
MAILTHLRALQAIDMALREGSLQGAAARLGISPAALGQRVRALEDYLGTDLLVRGRSGLQPTAELGRALDDLHAAFAALGRVADTLDFERPSEIHVVADPDWTELWLAPRLPAFRAQHPNIRFCINGSGDVPLRIGAPDIRIAADPDPAGETLYSERFVAVTGPDNLRRIADWDADMPMEGLPLLHVEPERSAAAPGWPDWFGAFGHRRTGLDRGVHYRHVRLALDAVRQNVGFLIAGLSLVADDLAAGRVVLAFPPDKSLPARWPYRMRVRPDAARRAQLGRFLDWLRAQAAAEDARLSAAAPVDAQPSPAAFRASTTDA